MIGLIGTVAADRSGLPVTLAALLPHGIVEILAMTISSAIGCTSAIRHPAVALRPPHERHGGNNGECPDVRGVILLMLLVAAFLESFVTTALVNFLTH